MLSKEASVLHWPSWVVTLETVWPVKPRRVTFWPFCWTPLLSLVSEEKARDFPGGPVVKNPPCNAGDSGSILGRGTKIPRAAKQLSPCTKSYWVHVPQQEFCTAKKNTAWHNEDPACAANTWHSQVRANIQRQNAQVSEWDRLQFESWFCQWSISSHGKISLLLWIVVVPL